MGKIVLTGKGRRWIEGGHPWAFKDDVASTDAEPGDIVHVFFAIYSPTAFADTVFVRWSVHDRAAGWQDSDRIPIRITGGREGGFRGTTTKQNYVAGQWRVTVETQDGREIARRHFTISNGPANPSRVFVVETY